ncbi:MAG: hypothetical protein ACXV3S_10225, partial [Kineosporiaceae bacterium]
MHARISLITADPARLVDAVRYLEDEARSQVEDLPGNLGMSMTVDSDLGVAVLSSFWVSGDAMRESEKTVVPMRREAARRATGTLSVEHYAVASFVRAAPPKPGAGSRLTRMEIDPARVDAAIAAYEDTALPWLTEADGFCSALLLVDRRTGRTITETLWQDPDALAASRSAAAQIRVDAVSATDAAIRALDEQLLA